MRCRHTKIAACVIGLALASAPVRTAHAQSLRDAISYQALTLTPAGGLPTSPLTRERADMPSAWGFRYGHVGPNANNVALSWYLPAGSGQFSLTGGTTVCDGCTNSYMLGADWLIPLNDGELRAALRPAVGAARLTGNGHTTYYSGALSMPISWITEGPNTHVIPFIEPGIGYGYMSATGTSESGNRFMTTGGLVVTGSNSPLSVLISARRVFLRDTDTIYGVGVSFNRH